MKFLLLLIFSVISGVFPECLKTVTTASFRDVPKTGICSGDLIFEDNFDTFNSEFWKHQVQRNNDHFSEFVDNPNNTFTKDGIFYLKPTLSGSTNFNKEFPVRSGRVTTRDLFKFKYGKLEFRGKIPAGDWLHGGIWMGGTKYGVWPRSGEIDLMENRGNLNYYQNGKHIGVEQVGCTLHWGVGEIGRTRSMISKKLNSPPGEGFHKDFHLYQMEWSEKGIILKVDNEIVNQVDVEEGFWKKGRFEEVKPPLENIWKDGTPMAPFDEEMYLLLSNPVGGKFFPHEIKGRPWREGDSHQKKMQDFMAAVDQWYPTWKGDDPALQIDYVKVWAL